MPGKGGHKEVMEKLKPHILEQREIFYIGIHNITEEEKISLSEMSLEN